MHTRAHTLTSLRVHTTRTHTYTLNRAHSNTHTLDDTQRRFPQYHAIAEDDDDYDDDDDNIDMNDDVVMSALM